LARRLGSEPVIRSIVFGAICEGVRLLKKKILYYDDCILIECDLAKKRYIKEKYCDGISLS
jgi:hypothetical protein